MNEPENSVSATTSIDPNDKVIEKTDTTDTTNGIAAVATSVPAEHISRLRELVDAVRVDLGMAAHWALVEMHELIGKIESL